MIVTDEAFDELLDRASCADGDAAPEEHDERRRQFVVSVDRAVKKALSRTDGRAWLTQTSSRHGCRLHFLRHGPTLYLVACLPLDRDDYRDDDRDDDRDDEDQ